MLLILTLPGTALAQQPYSGQVVSPDGRLRFVFSLAAGGVPTYSISYRDSVVVLPSRLGLLRTSQGGARDWNRDLRLIRSTRRSQNTTWKPVYGEHAVVRDHFNELTLSLQLAGTNQPVVQLLVRAYDAARVGLMVDIHDEYSPTGFNRTYPI